MIKLRPYKGHGQPHQHGGCIIPRLCRGQTESCLNLLPLRVCKPGRAEGYRGAGEERPASAWELGGARGRLQEAPGRGWRPSPDGPTRSSGAVLSSGGGTLMRGAARAPGGLPACPCLLGWLKCFP
ncbi:hypothetical protein NDU88_000335 [Pleurodeles waltl]|uniref:Uncharacterized protein n=1 Tax=Pleurodeles waltl TaxID=8319 RepID=A0AAV7P118_PLEWA|nr:hypothetical protein NDU88_000335 [Pleurodeles waltl]